MNLPSLFRSNQNFWAADPFARIEQLQSEMNRTFRHLQTEMRAPTDWPQALNPTCDVQDVDGHFLVSMDIPGMKKEDIKIELADGQLTISGERKNEREENKKGNYRSERVYGSFERTFTLPKSVKAEDISTEYSDGVLRLAIPKSEASSTKQIKIGEAKPGFFDRFLKKDSRAIDVKGTNKVA